MTLRSHFSRWCHRAQPALIALLATLLVGFVPSQRASAQTSEATIEISGRGWGHGRGLGQYGSYGYAEQGWSTAQILDHFYSNTTAGPAPTDGSVDPDQVRVDLRYLQGRSTTVGLAQGTIVVRGADGGELARVDAGAARLRWIGGGFELETAASCSGTFTDSAVFSGRDEVHLVAESSASGSDGLLHTCGPSYNTWYRGELRAVAVNGYQFTVNVVTIEDYLAGVVPNEMPASWPDAALQAQAVAARSYALAGDTRQQPYADTCDTTRCQVYDGAYSERTGSFRSSTHARTDAAIAATAGQVRLYGDGSVARTEFSSSTGGHTAGGDFPAVVDDGDSIAANPNHTWSTTVSAATIEARYDLGRLQEMAVVERNGLGADGGRALTVEFRFEQGTESETGDAVRSFLGLKSDWFTPGPVVGPDRSGTPEAAYIDRTYQTFTGRAATTDEIEEWFDDVAAGDRRAVTDSLVTSEFFLGELVDDLYQTALGRGPDDGGRAYWIERLRDGVKLESVGVLFYGSQEYYNSAGQTDGDFVTALYRDILGREPDLGGQVYWETLLANGAARLDDVAAGFYSSLESRRARVTALHVRLRGVAPSDEVRDALAGRLLDVDDLTVAAEIAASQEAYDG